MVTAVPMELADSTLEAEVSKGLIRVEEGLRDAARARSPCSPRRPGISSTLAASGSGPPWCCWRPSSATRADERIVPAAVAIELTHLATLYHDDVMDEAPVRRGHESANSRWSNTVAILTGDFLFARASRILADLGDEAIRIQAETFSRLVSGQIAETIGPQDGADPLEHYLRVVRDKTASLIATAGRFGAMFSGAPAEVVRRITPGLRMPSGWRSSCPTTSSTSPASPSSRARRPAPTCGRACGRCPCCTRCARPARRTAG